jgi:glycerol-3-phosphate O-acyltransferase
MKRLPMKRLPMGLPRKVIARALARKWMTTLSRKRMATRSPKMRPRRCMVSVKLSSEVQATTL